MIDSNAISALDIFLKKAITYPKQERYRTIIRSNKGYRKFINYLFHDFESHIKEEIIVPRQEFDGWTRPAYIFSGNLINSFGALKETIKEAFVEESDYGGWLIISKDGKYGIFRPEEPSEEFYIRTK